MGREINNTGRSTGKIKSHNFGKVEGPFVILTRELLEAPAWGILTLVDRRVLERLCIEHMAHAGTENGNLKCTFTDFTDYGIRRDSIADSIRRLNALGFIEVVQRGRISRAEFKIPAIYRLTFIQGNIPATNEWKRIGDKKTAKQIASKASTSRKREAKRKVVARIEAGNQKNKIPGTEAVPFPGTETVPLTQNTGHGSVTPEPDTEALPLSISWEGADKTTALAAAGVPTHTAKPAAAGGKVIPLNQANKKNEITALGDLANGVLGTSRINRQMTKLFGPVENERSAS